MQNELQQEAQLLKQMSEHLKAQRELLHRLTAEYSALAEHMHAASANINFINHEVAVQQKQLINSISQLLENTHLSCFK
jgi:uncharacterized membrane-anchored protein YhcB (DUF1043 family)